MAQLRVLQVQPYKTFRCIGADCEDTCCDGWGITVDRLTFSKYQNCNDPELGPPLRELVTINAESPGDDDHAMISLKETHCPFLADGWCSVQNKLGEEYLSNTCAIYPRTFNYVEEVLEQSIDLSCPEAARVVLLGEGRLEFVEAACDSSNFRIGNPSSPDVPIVSSDGIYPYFHEIRKLVIDTVHFHAYPLGQRLVIIAHFCDKVGEVISAGARDSIPTVISGYKQAIQNRLFDEVLSKCVIDPETQLVSILELVVNRITSDFTGRRFLDCYQEFMHGLEWTQDSILKGIASRYSNAYVEYYAPFMNQNESLMERYLVNYIFRNLFPFGRLDSNRKAGIHKVDNSISVQCMLMIAHYAIIRSLLIGMMAFHKSGFSMAHAIKLIQSATKAFQHSTSFPRRAIDILNRNGIKSAASMAVLVQDPAAVL